MLLKSLRQHSQQLRFIGRNQIIETLLLSNRVTAEEKEQLLNTQAICSSISVALEHACTTLEKQLPSK